MTLTNQQIDYISETLTANGIHSKDLKETIVDHICTAIEANQSQDFEMVYNSVIADFGGYSGIKQIQKETTYTLLAKKMLQTRKLFFVVTYTMIALLLIGTLFRMMHWPFGNILCTVSTLSLILFSLPLFIRQRQLKSALKTQQ